MDTPTFFDQSCRLMAEEEDENGWGAGYLYKDPDYVEGTHPMGILAHPLP
jgi:hypothetical protein